MLDVSKLVFFSYGVVARNKKRTDEFVDVAPVEQTSFLHGEITDLPEKYTSSGKDARGIQYNTEALVTATVSAKWLPMNQPNRISPPDVVVGEKVMLYRYADTDEYYWTTMNNDIALRRLETMTFGISSSPKDDETTVSPDTTYYVTMSSHDKHITLQTSKANQEQFKYTIKIDTDSSRITITDDINNTIFLDSPGKQIKLINAAGSFVDINNRDITINAIDNITMKAGKDITIDAGKNLTTKSGQATSTTAGTTYMALGTMTATVQGMTSATLQGGPSIYQMSGSGIHGTGNYSGTGTAEFKGTVKSDAGFLGKPITHEREYHGG